MYIEYWKKQNIRKDTMQYTNHYDSPLGGILLACDETGLTGLWFDGEKYFAAGLAPEHAEKSHPHFDQVRRWLDIYFSGRKPDFTPPLHMIVPCHRVVGTNGSLTGYAGGISKKMKLLTLEKADMAKLFIPTRGTAL